MLIFRDANDMKTLELFDLSGRVALVTGGAGHLGKVFAESLLECGARVALLDRDRNVWDIASQLNPDRKRARGFHVDLENEQQVRSGFDDFMNWSGGIDILVNNAAWVGDDKVEGWAVPFEQQRMEAFRRAIEVNLSAGFLLSQLAVPGLRQSGHGAIVNVGSMYGMVGPDWSLYQGTEMANPAAYAASKGGVLQLTRWLATTLAPHIRVNSISPGGVARGQDEGFAARYRTRTPLGRMATENDFRGALCFLASDASAYVTGHNLVVDGGWTAW